MSHNVPWTQQIEKEFRSRVTLSDLEDRVFTLHRTERYTQAQIAELLGISTASVNKTLGKVKEKYRRASHETGGSLPYFTNRTEMLEYEKRKIAGTHDISTSQMAYLIDEWVFDEKSRRILKRRLIDNIKYEQLADEFNMSVRQIKSIVCYAGEKVFRHI